MKKLLKAVSNGIIKKDDPNFKCSETFLSRLMKRLALIQNESNQSQISEENNMSTSQGLYYCPQYNTTTFADFSWCFEPTGQTQSIFPDSTFYLNNQMSSPENFVYPLQETQSIEDTHNFDNLFSWSIDEEMGLFMSQDQQNFNDDSNSFSLDLSTKSDEEK